MKKIFTALCLLAILLSNAKAERILENKAAWKAIPGAELVRFKDFSEVPAYIKFKQGYEIAYADWEQWIQLRYFKKSASVSFKLVGTESDKIGMTHYRYQQVYEGYPVAQGIWIVHTKNNKVVSMNGELFDSFPILPPTLSEASALGIALSEVGAETYKWQLPAEEENLKLITNNIDASYYPKGILTIINQDASLTDINLKLAWKFDIYAHEPLSRSEVYVDANSGLKIFENDRIHHSDSTGTAQTGYLATQSIITDYTGSNFRLRETSRGDGIQTYNLYNGTNYSNASDFTDNDNNWTAAEHGLDRYATDAHFGAEMTYDYYYSSFNRNSIDNNGFALLSYVHYSNNYGNAFWDGYRMTYGDGSSGTTPFTAIDITGHEITHGLTEYTANLVYSYESGALNESFSDIFGAAVEFFALGSAGDWLMGEDLGFVIRNMANPNQVGDPDTYQGNYWAFGAGDNGGVHTNSNVQNYWYYLLSQGGSGTNDNNDSYNVTGIGLADASAIAYRNLTVYLTTNSQYADARFYAIQSALDLFGACSQEVASCGTAWYAVGVGSQYSTAVVADFSASSTINCSVPFDVSFTDQSSNATTYSWTFGDGGTSTSANPTHTYTSAGTYTVVLSVSSTCGSDTKTETSFVEVGPDIPCNVQLSSSGQVETQSGCIGYLYDNGGPSGDYLPQTDSYITIAPCAADSITITFEEFNLESGGANCIYDFMEVYDGNSLTSPLIGKYCGSNLPPNSITSSGGAITIRMVADGGLEYSGFRISWVCHEGDGTPLAQFSTSATESCHARISFFDESVNCPDQWLWDFGDGSTSTDQNPDHIYNGGGTFTVKLIVSNSSGSDSIVMTNLITLSLPDAPEGDDVDICPGDSAYLIVSSNGANYWYDAPFSTTAIFVGDTFLTPNLNQSTAYWVESAEIDNVLQSAGPADNTFGGGGFLNFNQYLVFDAYSQFILHSVHVYANGAGDREIELRDQNGTVLSSYTAALNDGEQDVILDFEVEPGSDLQLGLSNNSMAAMYRNNNNVSYPYDLSGVLSITRSSAGQNPYGYYYFFYDWKIQQSCVSSRLQIAASTGECTGVKELNQFDVRMYPNPSHGQFTIESQNSLINSVEILNAQGQLVLTSNGKASNRLTLIIEQTTGVYLVKINTAFGVVYKRLIIE